MATPTDKLPDVDNQAEIAALVDRVRQAHDASQPLRIVGGDTKSFYGGELNGDAISTTGLSGVISYDPTELVVHVGAGTRLSDLNALLAEADQHLPFEPPAFGDTATIGGVVAAGLSGPARPYTGSVRDYVLGVGLINGRAEHLSFGGQVMKNVAGYDVSRLVTGSLGVLGLITDVSLKVLPRPAVRRTILFEGIDQDEAQNKMQQWAATPMPITAAAFTEGTLRVRLAGSSIAVDATAASLGADTDADGDRFWQQLRELTLPQLSDDDAPLWRFSVPPAAADIDLNLDASKRGSWIIDWGGAQRWLSGCEADAEQLRAAASNAGGHATLFRGARDRAQSFESLPDVMQTLHLKLKQAFDPKGVLNPGRLYPQF